MTYYPSASDSIFDFWHLVKFTYLLTYLLTYFLCVAALPRWWWILLE